LIDLAVTETTDAVMMTEAGEEMIEEILDEIITETSAETIDVAMIGITVTEEMTAEILTETMIGIVQNATIQTLLEE
jgi:chorismate mutase